MEFLLFIALFVWAAYATAAEEQTRDPTDLLIERARDDWNARQGRGR